MKILYLITKSNFGGAQKYVFDLATETKNQGFDISVYLGGEGQLKQKLLSEKITTHSIDSLERDISFIKEIKVFFNIISILKKEKPDIVHLNSSKIGGIGSLAARVAGIKQIIFTAHGWAFNENVSFLSKIFRKFISWLTVIFCTDIIATSEIEKEQVENWPFAKSKINVIPIGINKIDYLNKEEARNNLLKDENYTWIGSIGELHKNKGFDIAIKALSQIKDINFKYLIIGDGEEKNKLQKQILKLGLENKVYLLGKIDHASKYIKAFDIFLIPSRKEGLPYVLLEAALAEVPIISTRVGGIPEVVKENGTLIAPNNVKQLTKSIQHSINSIDKLNALAINLKNKVESEFSVEKMLSSTIALYKKRDTINTCKE